MDYLPPQSTNSFTSSLAEGLDREAANGCLFNGTGIKSKSAVVKGGICPGIDLNSIDGMSDDASSDHHRNFVVLLVLNLERQGNDASRAGGVFPLQ